MSMSPAEIVASLKELCAQEGPRISTQRIVRWIEARGGYMSDFELIQFAKKMRARQYARMLMYHDEESGLKIKRLWSFRDRETGERYYMDILQLPEERRQRLVRQYSRFLEQMRTVRQALSDYFAGQHFFGFFLEDDDPAADAEEIEFTLKSPETIHPPNLPSSTDNSPVGATRRVHSKAAKAAT